MRRVRPAEWIRQPGTGDDPVGRVRGHRRSAARNYLEHKQRWEVIWTPKPNSSRLFLCTVPSIVGKKGFLSMWPRAQWLPDVFTSDTDLRKQKDETSTCTLLVQLQTVLQDGEGREDGRMAESTSSSHMYNTVTSLSLRNSACSHRNRKCLQKLTQ